MHVHHIHNKLVSLYFLRSEQHGIFPYMSFVLKQYLHQKPANHFDEEPHQSQFHQNIEQMLLYQEKETMKWVSALYFLL